jgi:hypothetical protein
VSRQCAKNLAGGHGVGSRQMIDQLGRDAWVLQVLSNEPVLSSIFGATLPVQRQSAWTGELAEHRGRDAGKSHSAKHGAHDTFIQGAAAPPQARLTKRPGAPALKKARLGMAAGAPYLPHLPDPHACDLPQGHHHK